MTKKKRSKSRNPAPLARAERHEIRESSVSDTALGFIAAVRQVGGILQEITGEVRNLRKQNERHERRRRHEGNVESVSSELEIETDSEDTSNPRR